MSETRRGSGNQDARRSTGPTPAAILAWALGTPAIVISIVGTVAVASTGDISVTSTVAPMVSVTSLLVGAILVSRLPRNPIGWLLWISGLLFAVTRITQGLADHGLTADPGSIPGAIWFAWVNAWVGVPGFLLLGALLPLLYPTGQPRSPRWRTVVFAVIVETVALTAVTSVMPFAARTYPAGVENPLAIGGTVGDGLGVLQAGLDLVLICMLLLALVSVVARYRQAIGIERQQIRWFAFVGAISIVALVVAGLFKDSTGDAIATIDWFGWLIGIGGLVLLPVAIGIAILRYRLYEIDRIISRTIGWGLVSGVMVAVFATAILVFSSVLAPLTGGSTIAVAASTLLVASLFSPLRQRVQAIVDRRFNRARYDAERTIAAFADRLRDEVDLDQLASEIRATVTRTVAPATISVWTRE